MASALGRLPAVRCSWVRSRKSLTGLPAFFERWAAAIPQLSAPNFEPKPPPMTSVSTVTSSTARSNAWANSAPTPSTFWVLDQTVILASPSQRTVWPWVSRQTWVITGTEYVPSTLAAAASMAASGSPSSWARPCWVLPRGVSCGASSERACSMVTAWGRTSKSILIARQPSLAFSSVSAATAAISSPK